MIYAAARDSIQAALLAQAAAFTADRCTVVRVRTDGLPMRLQRIRGILRKARKRGPRWLGAKLRWAGAERKLRAEFDAEIEAALADHPLLRAPREIDRELWVDQVNGAQAQALLRELEPDLMLQNGAGLLAEPIFSIPRLGTWNVHHGYLPAIRGGDSLLWALLEGRPDWLGVSVHVIDAGIDTGQLLARELVGHDPGEHPGRIFARATEVGARLLGDSLARARAEDRIPYLDPAPTGKGVYRTMLDGGQLTRLWKSGFRSA